MFFNTDKKKGNDLAKIAFLLVDRQMKTEGILQMKLSKTEFLRFEFCLYIFNIISIMFWINRYIDDKNRTIKIINPMLDTFMDYLQTKAGRIRCGDFVVAPMELQLINKETGDSGIDENTTTDYKTLAGIIYNIRVEEYSRAFKAFMQKIMYKESEESPVYLNPVAKLFTTHFTGDNWENNLILTTELSVFLSAYHTVFLDLVKQVVFNIKETKEEAPRSTVSEKEIGSTQKSRTVLDEGEKIAEKAIVNGYRRVAAYQGCAPTSKTSDEKIIEIYGKVIHAFLQAARQKGEGRIPAVYLNFIALKFFQAYEMFGEKFMEEHLHYEVKRYSTEGLRPEYKQELKLF